MPFLLAGFAFSLTGFGSTGALGGLPGFFCCATVFARGFAFDLAVLEIAIAGDEAAGGISMGGLVMSFNDALNTLWCSFIEDAVRSKKLNDVSESCELDWSIPNSSLPLGDILLVVVL